MTKPKGLTLPSPERRGPPLVAMHENREHARWHESLQRIHVSFQSLAAICATEARSVRRC